MPHAYMFTFGNSCTVCHPEKKPAFWACPIISDVIKGMIKFSKLFICLLFFVLTCYYVFITGKLTKMSLGKWWHWCDPIIDKELPIGMVYALDVRFVSRWKMVDWSSTSLARMGMNIYTMISSLVFWSNCMMRWFISFSFFVH